MAQIHRTVLPPNTRFCIAIQKIFGIGRTNGIAVSEACGISTEMKVKDVKEALMQKVAQHIQENYSVGDQLKRSIREDILRLVGNKSRRGTRHEFGLPISGHTHSNASTAKKLRHLIMYDTSR
ncbi:MAG: hypothetical protein WDW38_004691 [Sanguina aurantia]